MAGRHIVVITFSLLCGFFAGVVGAHVSSTTGPKSETAISVQEPEREQEHSVKESERLAREAAREEANRILTEENRTLRGLTAWLRYKEACDNPEVRGWKSWSMMYSWGMELKKHYPQASWRKTLDAYHDRVTKMMIAEDH